VGGTPVRVSGVSLIGSRSTGPTEQGSITEPQLAQVGADGKVGVVVVVVGELKSIKMLMRL